MYWNKKKKQKRKKKNLLDERWHAVIFAWLRIIMQGKRHDAHTQHWMTWKKTKKTRTKKIAVFRVPRFANYSLEIRYFFYILHERLPFILEPSGSPIILRLSLLQCACLFFFVLFSRPNMGMLKLQTIVALWMNIWPRLLTKCSFLSECLGVSKRKRERTGRKCRTSPNKLFVLFLEKNISIRIWVVIGSEQETLFFFLLYFVVAAVCSSFYLAFYSACLKGCFL